MTLAVALTLGATAVRAQDAGGLRVVRRADRRALVLLLPDQLADPGRPVDVSHFVLIDRTHLAVVPLRSISDTSRQGCPRATELIENRVCVELSDASPPLADSVTYLFALDSIAIATRHGKTKWIGANVLITVGRVGARVEPPTKAPVTMIEITYDIESSRDSTLGLALTIGNRVVPIPARNLHAGLPPCYSRGSLSFKCFIDANVHKGDVISATFVNGGGATPPIAPAKNTIGDAVGIGTKDTTQYSLVVQGGLSQTNTARAATVQVLWRNMPIGLFSGVRSPGAWTYEGSLSPYLDALWTTDASTKGYINPGVQYSAFWSLAGQHVVNQIAAFLTPRSEADKKLSVVNFIPFDLDVKPGFLYLDAGALPLHGSYSIAPHAGLEIGWTIKGTSVARPETNSPSRLKAGIAFSAHWPAPEDPPPICRILGCGGFDVSADWLHYSLNDVPAHVTSQHDLGKISAAYKLTEHAGLSFSFLNGNCPPLFSYQRVLSLGLEFVY